MKVLQYISLRLLVFLGGLGLESGLEKGLGVELPPKLVLLGKVYLFLEIAKRGGILEGLHQVLNRALHTLLM